MAVLIFSMKTSDIKFHVPDHIRIWTARSGPYRYITKPSTRVRTGWHMFCSTKSAEYIPKADSNKYLRNEFHFSDVHRSMERI